MRKQKRKKSKCDNLHVNQIKMLKKVMCVNPDDEQ